MIDFQGDQDFTQDPATLWAKLRDAAFLADCIPDGSVEGTPTRDQAVCSIRPSFSFVRGSLELTLKITEAQEPTSVQALLSSKGIGSSSDVEATLTLLPQPPGTRVHWQAEVKTLGGLLKMVPTGLIRGSGQKVIEDLLTNMRKKLGE